MKVVTAVFAMLEIHDSFQKSTELITFRKCIEYLWPGIKLVAYKKKFTCCLYTKILFNHLQKQSKVINKSMMSIGVKICCLSFTKESPWKESMVKRKISGYQVSSK